MKFYIYIYIDVNINVHRSRSLAFPRVEQILFSHWNSARTAVNKIPPRNYRRREKARGKTRRNVCGEQQ